MAAWISATGTATDKVVLDPGAFFRRAELKRLPCAQALRPWVDYYWIVTWNLPAGATYESSTVPEPNCHLSVEYGGRARAGAARDGVFLTGVQTSRRFDVELSGTGAVVGVRFRPGGLTAMTGIEGWRLRDEVREAQGLLPLSERLMGLRADDPDIAGALDEAVHALPLRGDPAYDILGAALRLAGVAEPRSPVADVATECGMSVRQLQRLYRHFLGVGPQWMVARARVHAALQQLHEGSVTNLADLARELGWFDQAHLNRDFVAIVGESPGSYQRRCAASSPVGEPGALP